uniref:Uncharacterized protein n=1 Tax=Neobodo designis TaxID=312471 RepID=A0A6U4SS52_NEODS
MGCPLVQVADRHAHVCMPGLFAKRHSWCYRGPFLTTRSFASWWRKHRVKFGVTPSCRAGCGVSSVDRVVVFLIVTARGTHRPCQRRVGTIAFRRSVHRDTLKSGDLAPSLFATDAPTDFVAAVATTWSWGSCLGAEGTPNAPK